MLYFPYSAGVSVGPNWWRRGGPIGRGFASARSHGRIHAACDLCAPRGTDIRAICDGEVILFAGGFCDDTWQLVVLHSCEGMNPFIVRYGEVLGPGDGGVPQARGATVTGGSVIAKVGQLDGGGSMLHLELYASGHPTPSLSIPRRWKRPGMNPDTYSSSQRMDILRAGWHWRFQRRLDLADPTDFLLALRDGRPPGQPVGLPTAATHCCSWCEGTTAGASTTVYTESDFLPHDVRGRNRFLERMTNRAVQRFGMRYRISSPLGLDPVPSPREAALHEITRQSRRRRFQ